MPRYRRWAYRTKTKAFSNTRGRSWGRSRGSEYTSAPGSGRSGEADINIVVGRWRIWIFNNTEEPLVIMPGQYVTLEIIREGENQLGHFFRTAVLENSKARGRDEEPEAPEERPQDWI